MEKIKIALLPIFWSGWTRKIWSARGDLNPRPLPWQGSVLPLNYSRRLLFAGQPSPWQGDTLTLHLHSQIVHIIT